MQNSLKHLNKVILLDAKYIQTNKQCEISNDILDAKDDAMLCEADSSFPKLLLLRARTAQNDDKTNVMPNQNRERGNVPNNNDELLKRRRFRFTESERIQCVRELHAILSEYDFQNEEDVWVRLRSAILYNNPARFNGCSRRLLKNTMHEQVAKFRKYDEDGTESGKEYLDTPWGKCMKQLMPMWENYQKIKSTTKVGRPRKIAVWQHQDDIVDLPKEIRNAEVQTSEELLAQADTNDAEFCDNSSASYTPTLSPQKVYDATTKCNCSSKEDNVFVYLAEKARLEVELKREELQLKQQQHADQVRLQEESLNHKKAKLEFEKEKWQIEAQRRADETERNNLIINLLQNLIKK